MFKKILIALLALVTVFLVIVAFQPADFRVSRSAVISAPPEAVFAQVNDFHNWNAWSPWAKMDPNAKVSYEGPAAGPGAIFHWAGNREIGEGSMTITDGRPSDLIQIKLDFIKPFAGTSNAEFSFKPQGDQTLVTWSMAGKNNFIAKAIGLFIDCDKMIGDKSKRALRA